MIALTVMTGAVTKKGKLTFFTKVKLRLLLRLAKWLSVNRIQYRYVFPQGAQPGTWVRPCDLMSHYVLIRDPRCVQVHVPHGENLISRADRVNFVEQVVRDYQVKVFGFGMMFHPAHYRGVEDDPMRDIFDSDVPGELSEGSANVVPLKRSRR